MLITPLLCSSSGFVTEPISQERTQELTSRLVFSVSYEQPVPQGISSFAVSPSGTVAILTETFSAKTVWIYDSEGKFQQVYHFESSGSCGVDWDEETLQIFFVRSDLLVSVSPTRTVQSIEEVPDTLENNEYRREMLHKTKKEVNGVVYIMKNDFGIFNLLAPSYSLLVVQENGELPETLYDAGIQVTTQYILGVVLFLGMGGITVVGLTKYLIAFTKKQSAEEKTKQ